jgi:hypothetical protein
VLRASAAALGLLALIFTTAAGGGRAACNRVVTGGTHEEQAAVQRIVCRMPGTRVAEVAIMAAPPGAPAATRTIGIVVRPRAGDPPLDRRPLAARAGWEAELAAGAIRDGFARRGLSRVAAFASATSRRDFAARFYRPLGRPEWHLGRWQVRPGIRSASGKVRDGRWAALNARLRADARRYGLKLRVEQYNPYGKAPVVTVTTRRPQALLASRALRRLRDDLGIGGHRFDGAFLSIVGDGRIVFTAFSNHRTAVTSGCAVYVPGLVGHGCRAS